MTMRFLLRTCALTASATALLAGGFACSDNPRPAQPQPDAPTTTPPDAAVPGAALQIKTLSNRADLISGGDVLVEISGTDQTVHVVAGTTDVSSAFARRTDGRITGLVTGLPVGPTVLTADVGGKQGATLTITNHKIGGPVFSGAQVTPWVCAGSTPAAQVDDTPAVSQSGLSGIASTDGQCNIATEFKLYYRTTTAGCTLSLPDPVQPLANPLTNPPVPVAPPANGCFKPFDPANPPTDIATTTTDTGVTVPYIVRVERGTLNRGVYDIAVLFDPTQVGAGGWKSTTPPTTWNRKLLYPFGPATGQPRRQQRSSQSWAQQDEALKRGFLVAVSNMTDSALNSNRITMTESLMMMKEHIIDTYGEIRYAMGTGCSGGSINQLTSSSIFPGLLDGIQPSCTYSDSDTTGIEVADCESLVRFYASDIWKTLMATEGLTDAQNAAKQAAVNGHLDHLGCRSWFNSFIGVARAGNYFPERVTNDLSPVITAAATTTNNCTLPASMVYDPATNPTGVRCTGQDHAVSILGKVAGKTYAPTVRDNVGVVFGYKAFIGGAINGEEFVTLNENVGGADFDLVRTTGRSVADPTSLETTYKAGIVMDGHQLAKTAIIDVRGFDEQGIHYIWRSFALRSRLDTANKNHDNHVLWRFGNTLTPLPASQLTLTSLLTMDKWLASLKGATGNASLEAKVIASKPAEGFDFCYLKADTTFKNKVTDQTVCDADQGLKPHSSPRQVAGGPIAENIFKCQLKPFNAAEYPGLSADQVTRLAVVFPDGVCDWTKPGVGQQPAISPLDFSAGPGGAALPAAPVSQAK